MISNKKLATVVNLICVFLMVLILFFATAYEGLYMF